MTPDAGWSEKRPARRQTNAVQKGRGGNVVLGLVVVFIFILGLRWYWLFTNGAVYIDTYSRIICGIKRCVYHNRDARSSDATSIVLEIASLAVQRVAPLGVRSRLGDTLLRAAGGGGC